MKTGRKGFGEELRIVERYSELSQLYFQRLKERLESTEKKDQDFAIQMLNGAFNKMIPQNVEQRNYNINTDAELNPDEHDKVKQALLKSLPDSGSQE